MAKWREIQRRRLSGVLLTFTRSGPIVNVRDEVYEIQGPARNPNASQWREETTPLHAFDRGAPAEVLLALEVVEVALPKIEQWAARVAEARK